MTNSPQNLLNVRAIYQRYTGLPAVSLGIQHFTPQGGGYHEGNDLLAAAGRLNTDYSKRETHLDQPGTNDASAIDIGYFDVTLPNGRRVTLRDHSAWIIAHWDDAWFIREIIYSPDGHVVKRKDRLGIRTSGDDSHLTHDHVSYFRDYTTNPAIPAFHQRFWDEMSAPLGGAGGNDMGFVVELQQQGGSTWWWADGLRYKPIITWPQKLKYSELSGRPDTVVTDTTTFALIAGRLDTAVDPDEVQAAKALKAPA